jgi:hypothetical protein
MDLQEFSSALPKPWLNINANSLNAANRVTQDNGSLTPYNLFSSLNSFTTTSATSVNAMGTYVGTNELPANSLYPGHTTRIKVSGIWTSVAGDNFATIGIRNDAGDIVYDEIKIYSGGAATNEPWSVIFDIQFRSIGASSSVARSALSIRGPVTIGPGLIGVVNTIDDVVSGISTLSGITYNVYLEVSAAGSSITKNMSVATVVF